MNETAFYFERSSEVLDKTSRMGLSPLHVMYAGDRTSEMASSGPLGWLGWPGAGWNNLTGDILSVPQISWWAAFLAVCHVVFLDDFLDGA